MAKIPKVETYMHGDQRYAKYTDAQGCFQHAFEMKAPQPFSLVEIKITSGPHKGKKAITFNPTPYFPLERLPPELRQEVYKLVFWCCSMMFLGQFPAAISQPDRSCKPSKWTSLLKVNRAIGYEAKQVLWQSQHFVTDSMARATRFLRGQQSDGRQHITRLTVTKSGPVVATEFYQSLQPAVRLRCLTITLPSISRMPLAEHIDKHYKSLRHYLCPLGADLDEALRRLNVVYFDIGLAQRSVLDDKGEPIKAMTAELNAWCRRRMRVYLLDHFDSNAKTRTEASK